MSGDTTGEMVVGRDGATAVGSSGAGEASEAHRMETKTCPRCGAELFADMSVCYGCLYDFGARRGSSGHGGGDRAAGEARASLRPADPDDTVDLARGMGSPRIDLRVVVGPCEFTCPVAPSGLTVGRARDNDLVILDRTVSRHHLRLLPDAAGVLAVDQGATNPALVDGRRMPDSLLVGPGSVISVGEARLVVCEGVGGCVNEDSETPR